MSLAVRTRLQALRTARLASLMLLAEPCLRARLRARLALRRRRLARDSLDLAAAQVPPTVNSWRSVARTVKSPV